jgi:hypothetical protein
MSASWSTPESTVIADEHPHGRRFVALRRQLSSLVTIVDRFDDVTATNDHLGFVSLEDGVF